MKDLFLLIIFFITSFNTVFSQNYRAFEWDVLGISRLITTDKLSTNSVGFHTEARCNLNDKLSVGLRFANQFFDNIHDEPIRGFGVTTSVALTGDYYVVNNVNNRGFAGLAFGMFNNTAKTETGIDVGGSSFGIIPRIGYELDFFLRLTAAYNLTFDEGFPDYFSLGIALNFGGRYK